MWEASMICNEAVQGDEQNMHTERRGAEATRGRGREREGKEEWK